MREFLWEIGQTLRSRKMLVGLIILGIIVAVIVVLARRGIRRRAIRRELNRPSNVIAKVSKEVSELTMQCYQIGSTYSIYDIPARNHTMSPIWENTQQELVKKLQEGVPIMHEAAERAQKLKYPNESIVRYFGAALAAERQLQICSECRERQKSSRTFHCALTSPRNTGRLDNDGQIQLSKYLH